MQACFHDRIKTICDLFISQFGLLYSHNLHLTIQTLSELRDTVNSQLQKEKISEIKSQLPFILYIPWQK